MTIFFDWISYAFISTGCIFCLIGAIGLIRMPSFITRMHAASLIDSLGAILIITGLMLQSGLTLVSVKLLFILAFLLITGPTAFHALANIALQDSSADILNKE